MSRCTHRKSWQSNTACRQMCGVSPAIPSFVEKALATERWNRLHPSEPEKRPYVLTALDGAEGPIVAATDYMKIVPDQLAPWLGGRLLSLGTDGFGRSDNREFLRRHFEVDASSIAAAAVSQLARDEKFDVGR